jgi:CO/xanthine dehydrogenase Mo-binding subunit
LNIADDLASLYRDPTQSVTVIPALSRTADADARFAGMGAIGVSTPRRDSEPKVRGTTRFAADVPVPGLLHARLVLAHEAHATISAVRTDAAEALGGVVAVLTAGDLPLVGTGPGRLNEPLAREEVVYAGQPVALVVAESEALAEDGAELVQVELEPLEPVLELEAAARPGSPLARVRARAEGAGSDIGDAHASVSAGGIGEGEQLALARSAPALEARRSLAQCAGQPHSQPWRSRAPCRVAGPPAECIA